MKAHEIRKETVDAKYRAILDAIEQAASEGATSLELYDWEIMPGECGGDWWSRTFFYSEVELGLLRQDGYKVELVHTEYSPRKRFWWLRKREPRIVVETYHKISW